MMQTQEYWCHSCSKITLPRRTLACQFCGSEALELIEGQAHPAHTIPFSLPQQPEPQPQQQEEPENIPFPGSMMDAFFGNNMQGMFFRQQQQSHENIMNIFNCMQMGMPMRTYRVVTFVMGPEEEEEKHPVQENTIKQLQKVQSLSDDCAVCQEQEGSGLKLKCGHQFHEHCIRPWFQQKNTCPCCRATQV